MSTIILGTLDYANKLKPGGFTEQQAEAQARALAEIVERQLVSKHGADVQETELKRDIQESKTRLEFRIKELEVLLRKDTEVLRKDVEVLRAETQNDIAGTRKDIAETKTELIRRMVGVGVLHRTSW